MRLAIITNILAPYRIPLFEELGRRCQLQVLLLAASHANRNWSPEPVSFPCRVLPGWQLRAGSVDPIHINMGTWGALRRFRPDVVLGGGFTPAHMAALGWCRVQGASYVSWGELYLGHGSESSAIRRWVRRRVVQSSHGWIASSTATRDAFVHYGAVPAEVLVSQMPVRNAWFRQLADDARSSGVAHELRRRFGSPLVFGVGRLAPEKGWRSLLLAHAQLREQLPEASLVIAGEGPDKASLQSLAGELGGSSVHFIGHCNAREIAAWYAAADVFAFPTLCDPYGAVLAEAMACGALAVSSLHAAATRDLIIDGVTGFAVDPQKPGDLAQGLRRALSLPAEARAAMISAARSQLPLDDIVSGANDILAYARGLTPIRGSASSVHAKPG